MQLDGYNSSIGVAFEYQGEQHYKIVNPFTKTKAALAKLKRRDERKRSACRRHGVILIRIPYWRKYDMDVFLVKKLQAYGIHV